MRKEKEEEVVKKEMPKPIPSKRKARKTFKPSPVPQLVRGLEVGREERMTERMFKGNR